jgi:hypothetical protein
MCNIARHHFEIYRLPLFAWADCQRTATAAPALHRYRVNHRLEVLPIWGVRANG